MVEHCTALTPSLQRAATEWALFSKTIDDIIRTLRGFRRPPKWPVAGASGRSIGKISASDFATKLERITWTLVDAEFAALNGGVGKVESTFKGGDWQDPRDWLSAAEQIDIDAFLAYVRQPGGMNYLILHETAHVTELGIQTNNMQFDQYVHAGGDRTSGTKWAASPQWRYNEQVANAIARVVAQALALPILAHPTCGYPDEATTAQ